MARTSWREKMLFRGITVLILVITCHLYWITSVEAQLPFLPQITWETLKFNQNPNNAIVSGCVRLDGRCVFNILDQKSLLPQRIKYTESRLKDISQVYFAQKNEQLKVYSQEQGNQISIYVLIDNLQIPIITLYPKDATARGVNLKHQAEQIVGQLEVEIKRAKKSRSRSQFIEQAKLAGILAVIIIGGQLALSDSLKRAQLVQTKLKTHDISRLQSLKDYLSQKQKLNLQAIQYRLIQAIQIAWCTGGILCLLGLFPQTKTLQIWLITLIRIPLRIAIAGLVTYILIRFSNILITKLNRTLAGNYVMSRDVRRRTQIRIKTITRLVGGIIAIFWILLGVFTALSLIGINFTPLLAGAGIIGLAFSFASQNIIKDALNGFFIILEDQYAVGDVIKVGEFAGMVENLNLRITQLRDGQGRLITIPNSEIKTVANLSSQWSRAEIDVPVAYQVAIDQALEIITEVAQKMAQESDWQEQIIESPEVLGVDDFSDHGSVIRIWIKTEPLKQWVVAREFRHRLQKAFEEHHIPLHVSQQKVWLDQSMINNDKY